MTLTMNPGNPVRCDAEVIELAAETGRRCARTEDVGDRDAARAEVRRAARESGYLRLAVPAELGGLDADLRQVVLAQYELARHAGSAAMTVTTHLCQSLVQRRRYRDGVRAAENALRRAAAGELLTDDDTKAPPALSMARTWDVFGTVGRDPVAGNPFAFTGRKGGRPYGGLDEPSLVTALYHAPVVGAVYLGVARGVYDEALRILGARELAPAEARRLGEMEARLRGARWALLGAVEEIGGDVSVDEPALVTLMLAKRQAVCEAKAVVDLALDTVGGPAFFTAAPLRRAFQDVRDAPFHALSPETTLILAGSTALSRAKPTAG